MSRLNMDLIEAIYSESDRELTNDELYREVQSRLAISDDAFNTKEKFGTAGVAHNKIKHRIRWFQQTLKSMNVIERFKLWPFSMASLQEKQIRTFRSAGRGTSSGIQYGPWGSYFW